MTIVLYFLGLGLDAATPADPRKLASANVGFAFELLREIAREQPGANLFISPFGASSVLQMAGNGAAGRTKAEMQAVLGTAGLQPAALKASLKDIGKSLNGRGTASTRFSNISTST